MSVTRLIFVLDDKKYAVAVINMSSTLQSLALGAITRYLMKTFCVSSAEVAHSFANKSLQIQEITNSNQWDLDFHRTIDELKMSDNEELFVVLSPNSLDYLAGNVIDGTCNPNNPSGSSKVTNEGNTVEAQQKGSPLKLDTVAYHYAEFPGNVILNATDSFSQSKIVGKGGQASVYRANIAGKEYAVKRFDQCDIKSMSREIAILSTAKHPNIVTLVGVCQEQNCLINEFVSGGNLKDRMENVGKTGLLPLTWEQRRNIIEMIVQATRYLHSKKILHMDLKVDNVLLDESLSVKVADMGISRQIHSSSKFVEGQTVSQKSFTIGYVDPIYLSTGKAHAGNDIYSIGLIILQLCTDKADVRDVHSIFSQERDDVQKMLEMVKNAMYPQDDTLSKEKCLDIACVAIKCCQSKLEKRPSLEEIYCHVTLSQEYSGASSGGIILSHPTGAFDGSNTTKFSSNVSSTIQESIEKYFPVDGSVDAVINTLNENLNLVRHPWTELGKKYLYCREPCQQDYSQCYSVLKIAQQGNEPNAAKYMNELIARVSIALEKPPVSSELHSLAKEVANDGNSMISLTLGHQFRQEQRYKEALYWYNMAASSNEGALRNLAKGNMDIVIGEVCETTLKNSASNDLLPLVKEFASNGSPLGAFSWAHHLKFERLYKESLHWYIVASKDEDLFEKAMEEINRVSVLSFSSSSTSNLEVLESQSPHDPVAARRLAYLYDTGRIGVDKVDEKKAFQLYSKAATGGETHAQWSLACFYLNGKGVEKSKQLAMEWIEKAVENGHEHAARQLSLMRVQYSAPSQPFKWRIPNFSKLIASELDSDEFSALGSIWKLRLYPRDLLNIGGHISVILLSLRLQHIPTSVHCSIALVNFQDEARSRVMENYDELDHDGDFVPIYYHSPRSDILSKSGFLMDGAIEFETVIQVKV